MLSKCEGAQKLMYLESLVNQNVILALMLKGPKMNNFIFGNSETLHQKGDWKI